MIKNKDNFKDLSSKAGVKTRMGVAMLSVLLLSACDSSLPPLFGGDSPKRPVMVTQEEMDKQVLTVPQANPQMMDARNNKNLFGKSVRSDDERLDRLERSVQELRNDFDTVQPSIRRLMAVESDIQELIGELRNLAEEPSMMQPSMVRKPEPVVQTPYVPPAKKVKSKPSSYQKKSAPPVQGGKATVYDLRTGEHPGKTRLVLDTNTTASYNVDIDNNENIMVVDLSNTTWSAPMSKSFPKSSVISGYNVEKSDSGTLLVIQLKKNAKLTYNKMLPANSGTGKRIVLDISAQ